MDLVDRLFQQLVQATQHAPFHSGERALTVGEIYQHLIPYRAVRSELGIWELPQYEHALLRLLSGERGYLTLLEPNAQEELRRELASPNPILGIYRDYATAEVQLGNAVAEPSTPPGPPPPAPSTRPTDSEEASPAAAGSGAGCRRCGDSLPQVAGLRFCPSCGADQLEVPCDQCGAPLKEEWNFCIRCGTRRGGGSSPRRGQ